MVLSLSAALQVLGGLIRLLRSLADLDPALLLLTVHFLVVGIWVIAVAVALSPSSAWRLALVEGLGTVCLGIVLAAQWPVAGPPTIVAVVGTYAMLVGACSIGNSIAMRSQ